MRKFLNLRKKTFWLITLKLFLSIRKGPIFVNPEGSFFGQSVRVLFLSIRKGPIFVNPEGS